MVYHFNCILAVKLRFVNDFTGYEIMSHCMASLKTHCPFNRGHNLAVVASISRGWHSNISYTPIFVVGQKNDKKFTVTLE